MTIILVSLCSDGESGLGLLVSVVIRPYIFRADGGSDASFQRISMRRGLRWPRHASNWPAKSAVSGAKRMLERDFEERFRLKYDTVRLFSTDFMFILSGGTPR